MVKNDQKRSTAVKTVKNRQKWSKTQGFHPSGFSPSCSEFATFAKTVAICGDFHAVIWNVENTVTTAKLSHLEIVKKL